MAVKSLLRQMPGWFVLLALLWNVARAEPTRAPEPAEPSFRNEVMAVLSKAGCNAGTCHGNKNGKGGFKLSLRGQDPELDYLSLTRDVFARRANSLEPEQSLILLKPTMQVAHEGGLRFKTNSTEYAILRQWLASGTPDDIVLAPRLQGIAISPPERVLIEPEERVQLQVTARFSDGTERDITPLAVYEPVNNVVKVLPHGSVEHQAVGEATVLVRYLQCQEAVRLAFVPARLDFKWTPVPPHNYIDEHILAKLRTLRMNPSGLCADHTFLRRAYLDLLGILPTAEEARTFVADKRPDKRPVLIGQLLERPEFADFWSLKWADLLRVEAHSLDQKGVQNFHHWIRQSIADNKPLDQFARELITARGSTYSSPAANYYRPNREAATRAKAAAQLFLGTRLQCAECHNHPSDRWTQDDYYDWAALFAPVRYKVIENKREISSDEHEWNGEQVVFLARDGSIKNPRTGKNALPRFLGELTAFTPHGIAGENAPAPSAARREGDSLEALAVWLTSRPDLTFARVQANRVWFHLMGRGLVDPPDDFRATNPASHPELLDALARDWVKHHFDLRYLIRLIINSRAYQLAPEPNQTNEDDERNFSHPLVRRLGAEQLLDCQSQVTGVPLKFLGYPKGLRAAQLPGVRPESKGKRRANQLDQFLELFGKPPRLITTDTERSCECNMSQAFQMISGPTVNELLSGKENRVSRLLLAGKSNREILEELFWTALTRAPTAEELQVLLSGLDATPDRRAALEDVLWGLLNSKDFVFRK
jgi:hypothetical protein